MNKPFDGAKAAYEDGQSRLDELKRQLALQHDEHVRAFRSYERAWMAREYRHGGERL